MNRNKTPKTLTPSEGEYSEVKYDGWGAALVWYAKPHFGQTREVPES
jgi:hypothetical protein